jgi:hypothetical protein
MDGNSDDGSSLGVIRLIRGAERSGGNQLAGWIV